MHGCLVKTLQIEKKLATIMTVREDNFPEVSRDAIDFSQTLRNLITKRFSVPCFLPFNVDQNTGNMEEDDQRPATYTHLCLHLMLHNHIAI